MLRQQLDEMTKEHNAQIQKLKTEHDLLEESQKQLLQEKRNMRQQLDEMTKEHNAQIQKLKTENDLLEESQKQLLQEKKYMDGEIESLQSELRIREQLEKSPEAMREICVKNEITLCKEFDYLQDEIARNEYELNELRIFFKSEQFASREERDRRDRQMKHKEKTINILKKQKEVKIERLNTVQATLKLLEQKSAATLDVTGRERFANKRTKQPYISKLIVEIKHQTSQNLKQLIEKDVRLEMDYNKIEKVLQNHERLDDVHAESTPQDLAGVDDPQKIVELYKSFYDIHWHDALKVANRVDHNAVERTKVKGLLNIFKKAFAFCKDAFDRQKLDLIDKLNEESIGAIHPDEARVIQQMRNGTTSFLRSFLYQVFQKTICSERYGQSLADDYPIFIKESIRICWLMNLHDPPVVLEDNLKSGDEIDPECYVKYRYEDNNKVDFVVLPTLILRDGSIIAKGVVQCKKNQRKTVKKSRFIQKSVK